MSERPEERTRRELIDQQLNNVGWEVGKPSVVEELRLTDSGVSVRKFPWKYRAGDEFADYALMGIDGKPLAIVEAKNTNRDVLAGQRQASDYADRIRDIYEVEPFIFLSNGREIWFWDRGCYPLRKVSGFFSRDDLERLAFQRKHRLELEKTNINGQIIDRPYQLEAVRSVSEKMTAGHRRLLMVTIP